MSLESLLPLEVLYDMCIALAHYYIFLIFIETCLRLISAPQMPSFILVSIVTKLAIPRIQIDDYFELLQHDVCSSEY